MNRKRIIGRFTTDLIHEYLKARVYETQGRTRAEYIDACKLAWRKVRYDPVYSRKVIIDFSQPVTLTQLFGLGGLPVDFVDPALASLPVHGMEQRAGIECLVVSAGPAPDENGNITPVTVEEMFRPKGAPDVTDTVNEGLYLVALFDVLGFSALVKAKGASGILNNYQTLMKTVVLNTNYTAFGRIRIDKNRYGLGSFYAPIQFTYFSDTILLWTNNQFTYVAPFLTKCADLICEALAMGMPLRGSICFGNAVMDKTTNTFVGEAIVEASDIEKNQRWIGATLGSGFALSSLKDALSEALVAPLYTEHFKPEMSLTFPYLTLDWVKRWASTRKDDLLAVLVALRDKAPPKNKPYYDHTIDFVRYTAIDSLASRGSFLRATTYRVTSVSRLDMNTVKPYWPVVLKIRGDIPHSGHLILPGIAELINSNEILREKFHEKILFVKRLDYDKFVDSLPTKAFGKFDLNASGLVYETDISAVEYIDFFDQKLGSTLSDRELNIEIIN